MKFTTVLGTFFCSLFFFLIGILILLFVTHVIVLTDTSIILNSIYNDFNLRVVWGIVGVFLVLLNLSFVQILVGKFQKEKNIAFVNPEGEVTISLAAVEGLIKRLTQDIAEIKEIKPDVTASKKGIDISLKVTLRSEINIPDTAAKLQALIKTKVQELLGIEQEIRVKVHVVKIIASEEINKKEFTESQPTVPFQGYK